MNPVAIWTGVTAFVKKIPDWAWYVFLIIAAGVFIDQRARFEERANQKAKNAKATDKTLDTIERKADAHIEQAERIRANNPVTGDPDRVSDKTLDSWHYRN